jgi:hypothetical protein
VGFIHHEEESTEHGTWWWLHGCISGLPAGSLPGWSVDSTDVLAVCRLDRCLIGLSRSYWQWWFLWKRSLEYVEYTVWCCEQLSLSWVWFVEQRPCKGPFRTVAPKRAVAVRLDRMKKSLKNHLLGVFPQHKWYNKWLWCVICRNLWILMDSEFWWIFMDIFTSYIDYFYLDYINKHLCL